MRKKPILTILTAIFVFTELAGGAQSRPKPLAVSLIWDTSPSLEKQWKSVHLMAKLTIDALEPGDYLEVISAHKSGGQLRYAGHITETEKSKNQSKSSLQNIKRAIFLQADLGSTLAMARQRLKTILNKDLDRRGVIIILTDAHMQYRGLDDLLVQAAQCHEQGIDVYITGDDKTSKELLIAAVQKRLTWSTLRQANPALWLEKNRIMPEVTAASQKQAAKQPKMPSSYVSDQAEEVKDSSKLQPGRTEEIVKAKPIITQTKATVTLQSDVSFSQTEPDTEPITEPESALSEKVRQNQPSAVSLSAEDSIVLEARDEPNQPIVVNQTPPTASSEPIRAIDHGSLKNRISRWSLYIGSALLFTLILLTIVRGAVNGQRWQKKLTERLKRIPSAEAVQILYANCDGQSYRLGRTDRLQTVHIGSGPHNSLRINDKSIAPRHIRIQRVKKRLSLTNLAPAPVAVNGSALKPRRRKSLTLPALIRLSDSVTLKLETRPELPGKDAKPQKELNNERES